MKKDDAGASRLSELRILKGAIENTNEAFVTIDRNSTVLVFNKAAEKIFGYRRQDVLGRDLALILGPGCREGHQQAVGRYLRTKEPRLIGHETEFRAMRKNGELFPAAISFSVVELNGEIFFTGIIRDLTETMALQEKIIAAERLAALGQAVAEISHEIRNPLMLIGGFAGQLLKAKQSEKARAKLNIIAGEVKRLEKLLAELKDLYTPRAMLFEKINVADLLAEVYHLNLPTCQHRDIELSLQVESQPAWIDGDRQKLKQVLLNVVKNGMEALSAGGQLALAARLAAGRVEITITDAGPGIPPHVLKKIFTPFFTTKEKGTGLGLSISKRIIEDHPGGAFRIDSQEEQGTVVKITLPAAAGGRP